MHALIPAFLRQRRPGAIRPAVCLLTGGRAGPLAALSPVVPVLPVAAPILVGALVPAAVPAVDEGVAIDRTVVSLVNFVPEPAAGGHVAASVSRSMTATGAQPLVHADIDKGSIERQARQAQVRGERPPPPTPLVWGV